MTKVSRSSPLLSLSSQSLPHLQPLLTTGNLVGFTSNPAVDSHKFVDHWLLVTKLVEKPSRTLVIVEVTIGAVD